MPLDPQARQLLDQLAAMNLPPTSSLTPEQARAQMLARRAAMPPGEPVARVEDLSAPGPDGPLPLRLYVPATSGTPGLVVYFHGGGWVIGNIESHDALCRGLANASGSAVLSVDYRLAPEHKFPAAAEDAYAATLWAAANAASLGADGDRLAVAGDSAGGNLAAAVCLMARERGGPRISFQLLIYPVTDYDLARPSYSENAEGYLLTRDSMRWFWDHYLASPEDAKHPYAAPLQASDLSGLPPALVITAEYDPLRDEGEAYAARLRAAGVPTTLHRYDGMIHGFVSQSQILDQGRAALQESAASLRRALQAPATV